MSPLFYFLAILTLAGATASLSLRHPVHCALCLVVTFVGLAGIYLGMGAHFLGLAQVLVYVGAVAILLVFVMLLTRGEQALESGRGRKGGWAGVALGAGVAGVLGLAMVRGGLPRREAGPALPSVRDLGEALMTDFVVPLQVVGVLLTAALIGAAILALPHGQGWGGRRGLGVPKK